MESEKIKKKRRVSPFMLLSLVSAVLYTAVVVSKLLKNTHNSPMFYVLLTFAAAYLVFFAVTLIVNARNKNRLKKAIGDNRSNLKIYKSSVRILKNAMVLFNLLTAAMLAFQTGETTGSKLLAIATSVFSGAFALFCIFRNVLKIRKTVKKRVNSAPKTKTKPDDTIESCVAADSFVPEESVKRPKLRGKKK